MLLSLQYPKSAGIYMIKNLLNGRFYIGATNHIYTAILNHRSELNRGVSRNRAMQIDWDNYGEEGFAFMTLEKCHVTILKEREESWLKKAKVEESNLAYNKSYRGYNQLKRKKIRENIVNEG